MKRYSFIFVIASVLLACCSHPVSKQAAESQAQSGSLPRAIDSAYCQAFDSVFYAVNATPGGDLHSLMVIQDGKVIYERYGVGHTADELHIMWSATKTFTAVATGFAWQDGLISIDTPIVNYLADELPDTVSPYLNMLTLDHLLKMGSGWKTDLITTRIRAHEQFDPVRTCLSSPFTHEPGTHWRYDNMDTYIAGVIVQKQTGKTLAEYLQEKLFAPLGVDTFYYEQDCRGFNTGAWGLHLTTETLAKLGLFILQRGEWNGVQLLDSAWIDRMMQVHIMQAGGPTDSDWRCGYCYQSWACHIPGSIRADGMWGQYAIVLPDKNAVVTMTTICSDREAQLNAVWEHIYPHL